MWPTNGRVGAGDVYASKNQKTKQNSIVTHQFGFLLFQSHFLLFEAFIEEFVSFDLLWSSKLCKFICSILIVRPLPVQPRRGSIPPSITPVKAKYNIRKSQSDLIRLDPTWDRIRDPTPDPTFFFFIFQYFIQTTLKGIGLEVKLLIDWLGLIGGHLLWKIVKGPLGSRVKGLPGLGDKRVTLMGPTCQGFLGLV